MLDWLHRATLMGMVLLAGCASSGTQKDFIGDTRRLYLSGEYDKAYRSLEDGLEATDSATRLASYDFLVAHPELRLAAARSFEPVALERTFSSFDPSTARSLEQVRLSYFSKFALDDEVSRATINIDSAYLKANSEKAAVTAARLSSSETLLVNEAVFVQLSSEDQDKIRAGQPSMQVVPMQAVGTLVSHQIVDMSKPGTTIGTQLGSAIAQAAYIDQARFGNYSAVTQIGAGLVGAVIGSSLDKSAQKGFLINYGIKLMDGSVKAILNRSVDGIAAPIGQCVFVSDATEAPPNLCADNLVSFLQRAQSLNADKGGRGRGAQIVCQVSGVGKIQLSRADCSKLGSPVE